VNVEQRQLSAQAHNFNWLLERFVEETSGVTNAIAVSSDGLLMAMSSSIERATAEQLSAIISGLASLGHGTARCFGLGGLEQVIIALRGGFLFVASVSDGSCLGVVADASCDVGNVGYQMGLLVERAGAALTPALVAELKEHVLL
jgi:predicted regulator of Ras-like GTPase activity (Roadblock/LC7/MglB family)